MLSGGMKRRLMIARALVHEPRLLILDEPTAGVDIEMRRSMWEFLRKINAAGTTIILTTHYLEEAEALCRHIAIINHGWIVENSSIKDLLRRLHREVFILDCVEELPETVASTVLSSAGSTPTPSKWRSRRAGIINQVFVPWAGRVFTSAACATAPIGWRKCSSTWSRAPHDAWLNSTSPS